jgi:hypothetical protein
MSYLFDEFNIGLKVFLILIVVMLDTMLVSVLSIIDVNLEYLKTPSNFCKTSKLYSVILSVISDFIVSEDFVVNLGLYFTLEFTIKSAQILRQNTIQLYPPTFGI